MAVCNIPFLCAPEGIGNSYHAVALRTFTARLFSSFLFLDPACQHCVSCVAVALIIRIRVKNITIQQIANTWTMFIVL